MTNNAKVEWTPEMDAALVAGRRAQTPVIRLTKRIGVPVNLLYVRLRELGLPVRSQRTHCRARQQAAS